VNIKPIRTKADYKAALKQVSKLVDLDPNPGTVNGDMLDIMATLLVAFEAKHFPMLHGTTGLGPPRPCAHDWSTQSCLRRAGP
jgi:antitoxin component HigA of HigAB toxin-antitoxin module